MISMRSDNGQFILQGSGQKDWCTSKLGSAQDVLRRTEGNRPLSANNSASIPEGLKRFDLFTSSSGTTVHASSLEGLTFPTGSGFETGFPRETWWLDVLNPTKDDIKVLAKAFSIHPLTCEAIRTEDAPEKVEIFENYYFVCFRSFINNTKVGLRSKSKPVNFSLVVFPQGIITFSFQPSQHSANVRERIRTLRKKAFLSSPWICYALMYVRLPVAPYFDPT